MARVNKTNDIILNIITTIQNILPNILTPILPSCRLQHKNINIKFQNIKIAIIIPKHI